jgi:hypothetical protein
MILNLRKMNPVKILAPISMGSNLILSYTYVKVFQVTLATS